MASRKKWLKITIKAEPVLVEAISDFLIGIIGAGVETGAIDEDTYGTVVCYVEQSDPDQPLIDTILGKVSSYLAELALLFDVAEPTLTSTVIVEKDWGEKWKEHFKPFAIVPGLIISPTWEEYRPSPGELLIEMDPGMAFGTGHHATTSLSLEFMKEVLESSGPQMRVLDVGTGTGILGIAAALFGADEVLGIDNDPDAVTAAKGNVIRNKLDGKMQVGLVPLASVDGSYGMVVANIIHDVLVEMLDDFTRLTADNGVLILSGILVGEQVENLENIFTAAGFSLKKKAVGGEWAALMFFREGSS